MRIARAYGTAAALYGCDTLWLCMPMCMCMHTMPQPRRGGGAELPVLACKAIECRSHRVSQPCRTHGSCAPASCALGGQHYTYAALYAYQPRANPKQATSDSRRTQMLTLTLPLTLTLAGAPAEAERHPEPDAK